MCLCPPSHGTRAASAPWHWTTRWPSCPLLRGTASSWLPVTRLLSSLCGGVLWRTSSLWDARMARCLSGRWRQVGVVGGAERPWGVVIGACPVSGSLDRCVGGVAADIILEHSQAPPSASEGEEPTALRVINLHPMPSDPVIQVSQRCLCQLLDDKCHTAVTMQGLQVLGARPSSPRPSPVPL